ncbi:MAG TPA: hypothetical protein VIM11_07070 [Tepidisphaeraceae bacterium]|jgi:hypothetical protein
MDPIQRKIVPDTQGPASPDKSQTGGTTKKFEVGSTGGLAGGDATQGVGRPNFERIAAQLQDCASKNMTRDQARSAVIESETQHLFGKNATPQMATAVSDAFSRDPHLSQLFNRLYSSATNAK